MIFLHNIIFYSVHESIRGIKKLIDTYEIFYTLFWHILT